MSEAAEALGISYQSIWRLIRRGLLKTSGGLRHKLISLAELQRYLAETT
jgi:excisionase family DNA binding protein